MAYGARAAAAFWEEENSRRCFVLLRDPAGKFSRLDYSYQFPIETRVLPDLELQSVFERRYLELGSWRQHLELRADVYIGSSFCFAI